MPGKDNQLKIFSCGDMTIEIHPDVEEYGGGYWGIKWKLIAKKDGIELAPSYMSINQLCKEIGEREDYLILEYARKNNIDLSEDFQKWREWWLDIGASSKKLGILVSNDVALIPSEEMYIKGKRVIPKKWPYPVEDKDEKVSRYCNFWLNYYPKNTGREKLCFRLKCCDEDVDLDPICDRNIIREILENAVMIFTPDLRPYHELRSIPPR